MLYNVEKFTFKDLSVRRIKADGINWVCVLDLCKGLQLSRSNNALRSTIKGEKTRKFWVDVPVAPFIRTRNREQNVGKYTGKREMLFTDESGVYTLILRSNKPEAEEFRHWVTSEVLPSIREVGSYTIPQLREQQQTDEGKQLTLFEEKAKTLTEQKISFEVFVKVEGDASICTTVNFEVGTNVQQVITAWDNICDSVNNVICRPKQ